MIIIAVCIEAMASHHLSLEVKLDKRNSSPIESYSSTPTYTIQTKQLVM